MEKPKIENYKLGKGFHTHNFVSALTLYTDQVEAENKELTEALKDLMKGVDDLPQLTAIQGVLTRQYKRAEKAIQGNN